MANDDAVREAAAKLLAANEGAREYGQTQSIAQKMAAKELREALAAAPAAPPAEQPDEVRQAAADIERIADEHVGGYEMRGDDGDYYPSEDERALIRDAVRGWLADEDFRDAFRRALAGKGEENLPTEGKGE